MELSLEASIVGLLSKIILAVKSDKLNRHSILTKGRLSYDKIFNTEYCPDDIDRIARSSMLSCPSTYHLFRKLKFLVEQRDMPTYRLKELSVIYANEILEVHSLDNNPSTTMELSKENYALYKRLCSIPDWPRLKYILLPNSNSDFIYWVDQDLLDEAGKYNNFTELKMKGGELHRHIIARELQKELLKAYPKYNTNVLIGLDEHRYRSQGELVFGNMIILAKNQCDFQWQVNTNLYRENSNKPMTSDFYCISIDLHIEISMFVANDRGSRGLFYESRRQEKKNIYQEVKLNVEFIDSSSFYVNGCIEASLFANRIIDVLKKHNYNGLDSALAFNDYDIGFFESVDTRLDLDCKTYCEFLGVKYGLTHMSQLSNDKSYLLSSITLRPDNSEIFAQLKKQGYEQQREGIRRSVKAREYATLDIARKFAAKHKLLNQIQWENFAKNNKELLNKEKIPSNVSSVYSRLGEWINWTHFFELARK